jgi:hypothetical protein
MFKPFGCRATVFIGDHKHLLSHHKLSARGIPCIYLGPGFSRSYKGWICFDPETQRLFCTRHVVFDETFFSARVQEQSILGHFDPTPCTRIQTLLHCSLDKAITASDEVNTLPLAPTLEIIENLADFSDEELQERPCGRLKHLEADEGLALHHEDATLNELFASVPSGGTSATASGGNSTAASGGASITASGGDSTAVSGGNQLPCIFSTQLWRAKIHAVGVGELTLQPSRKREEHQQGLAHLLTTRFSRCSGLQQRTRRSLA